MLHFVKREYESAFVHRFSNATMPLRNMFKNSTSYWGISGILLAYSVYSNSSPSSGPFEPALAYPGVATWLFGEFWNLKCHAVLRDLRPLGTTRRALPAGFGFGLVTCPHYLFETVSWLGLLIISRSWIMVLFILASILQMGLWAKKKETRYRLEFKDTYKPKKYGVIPGLI
jgi:very-long-chain enoyl-CoA reductase